MKNINKLKPLALVLGLVALTLTLLNCGGTDDPIWTDDGNDTVNNDTNFVTDLITQKVFYNLPDELIESSKDWTVNTIFSGENKSPDSLTAEFNDLESKELVTAFNANGNVCLMAFASAGEGDSVELSLETTAKAMVMLMPWTQNMSSALRQEVMDNLSQHAEFDNLVNAINGSLQEGELDPLLIGSVLNDLAILQDKVANKKLEVEQEPISFVAENNKIIIENKLSSAYLGVGLYDEDNKVVKVDKIEGYNKSSMTLDYLKSRIFETPLDFPEIEINVNKAGTYRLVVDNGFTGEDSEENSLAFNWNLGKATLNVFSVVSPIFKASNDNIKCVIEFSEKTVGFGSGFSSTVLNAVDGEANFFLNSIDFVSEHTISLAEYLSDCLFTKGYRPLGINSKVLKKILNTVSIIGKVQTAIDATFFAADIFAYNDKMTFCLEMDDQGEFEECNNATREIHQWFEGLYTLKEYDGCGTRAGQSGKVYFMIRYLNAANGPLIRDVWNYRQGLESGMPNIYQRGFKSSSGNNVYRYMWQENKRHGICFNLDWIKMPLKGPITGGAGWMWKSTDVMQSCGDTMLYEYNLSTNATFVGFKAPIGVDSTVFFEMIDNNEKLRLIE